ncbi:MAG: hypothetical protein IT433_05190 [Phycisphaerales bacterium]|nr:hypothetical protein [Phycisphaerales bacterium]
MEARSLIELTPSDLAPGGALPSRLRVPALTRPFNVTLDVPGNEEITLAMLLLGALASDACELYKPRLDGADAGVMLGAIGGLGARVERAAGGDLVVWGCGPRWKPAAEDTVLALRDAGTPTRLLSLAAMLAPPGRTVAIHGSPELSTGEIGAIVRMIRALGGEVDEVGGPGCWPIRVHGLAEESQFTPVRADWEGAAGLLPALLLIGPFAPYGSAVFLAGESEIGPEIRRTMELLDRAGAAAFSRGVDGEVCVQSQTPEGELGGFQHTVEPDAALAGLWWTAAVMCPGSRATVNGRWAKSVQAGARIANVLLKMSGGRAAGNAEMKPGSFSLRGAERVHAVEADVRAYPDAGLVLAAACAVADAPSVIRGLGALGGLGTLGGAEDRVGALADALTRLGCGVRMEGAGAEAAMHISPLDVTRCTEEVVLDAGGDARVATALALVGLRRSGVIIARPECVARDYPGFWGTLRSVYG